MNKQEQSPIYTLQDVGKKFQDKEPIRKGCDAEMCLCIGTCQEIIGWKDKETTPFRLPIIDNFPVTVEESHFEDIEPDKSCHHIQHNPPTHLNIPHGKRYIHICPGCKARVVLQPPQIRF